MKQTTDFKNTYWDGNGKYENESKEVRKYIPDEGEAKTPELNLYRIMANIYYDLYNNGLCNWDNYEHEAKYYLSKFKEQIKSHTEKEYSANSIIGLCVDEYFESDWNIRTAFEDVMNAAILIAYNSLKETSIGNDSLELGKWTFEESANDIDVLLYNGKEAMPVFASLDSTLNLQYRNPKKRMEEAKLICEAVNNYNALKNSCAELTKERDDFLKQSVLLKQINKELIEALYDLVIGTTSFDEAREIVIKYGKQL